MNAEDLLNDLGFQHLCWRWEREGRCPENFAEYLLDHGLEIPATCARWCYAAERGGQGDRRVYPDRTSGECWFWWKRSNPYPDNLPVSVFDKAYPKYEASDNNTQGDVYGPSHATFPEVVHALFVNWEEGAESELERAT